MKMLIIQHNDVEEPGLITNWATNHNYDVTILRPDQGDNLTEWRSDQIDMLVVLGGEQDVNNDTALNDSWIYDERILIRRVHKANHPILGISLGAEQIVLALGGYVDQDTTKEIGWWPINKTDANKLDMPNDLKVFNWHQDSFSLPVNSKNIFSNQHDKHQGFKVGKNVIGLQFHLEMTKGIADSVAQTYHQFIDTSDAPNDMQQNVEQIKQTNIPDDDQKVLNQVLDDID